MLLLATSLLRAHDTPHALGLAVILGALALAGLNAYLSFARPLLYQRTHGSLDGCRHISPFPLIGSLLVIGGALASFGSALCAVLGLIAVALDTGGAMWLVIATWRDASLWDR